MLLYRSTEEDEGIHTMESEEDEFAAVQRNSEILKSVSKPLSKQLHDTFTHCGPMLGQRRRRWPNIDPTLGECLMFAGCTMKQPTHDTGPILA